MKKENYWTEKTKFTYVLTLPSGKLHLTLSMFSVEYANRECETDLK